MPASEKKECLEWAFWHAASRNLVFGRLASTVRTLTLENRLMVQMKYTTVDRFYLDIITTRQFVQQIADGYKSKSKQQDDYQYRDHLEQWQVLVAALQRIY